MGLHPLSPYDMDQHYLTVVWTGQSARWAMFDPSFGTCFQDPDGTILSPWKLRQRFADEAEVSCDPSDFGDDPRRGAVSRWRAGPFLCRPRAASAARPHRRVADPRAAWRF